MLDLTTIFLIRHSEQLKLDVNNLKEDSQIKNEKIILSITGEKKANKISRMKELKKIDKLYSSNYVRAISTAKYIACKNNIDINIDEGFNERKLRRFKRIRKIRKK